MTYLSRAGISKSRIHVFTQTEEDYKKYVNKVPEATIHYTPAKRAVEARNNILNELSENEDIIMLDDDVRQIGRLKNGKIRKIEGAQELDETFDKCFKSAKRSGSEFFGIYPVYNDFFMENSISTRTTVNTVFGFAKGFKFRYDENYDTKEDAELCGRVLSIGGKILRFNFLAVDADHRKTKDGYIDDWHQEENVRCVKQLCFSYPEIFAKQKDKPWEVRVLIKDKKIQLKNNRA